MWQRKVKKAIFTLNIDNYASAITEITYPLIMAYAEKIGAEFVIIKERKFPDYPVVYEKLQIHELGQMMNNEWNIFIDSDALIHPDLMDFTVVLPKDTVAHHGNDFAPIRWKYDRHFLRDGRHIGSGNWFTLGSDLCIDLWKPFDDMTLEEAISNIYPTVDERNSGVIPSSHLIDDYTLSRNIAKYGFKFQAIRKLLDQYGFPGGGPFFWHQYLTPIEAKVAGMKKQLSAWRLT